MNVTYKAGTDISVLSAKATDTLSLSANLADGDAFQIGARLYVSQTVLTNISGHFLIGATAADTIDNFVAAIKRDSGGGAGSGSGTLYAAATTVHTIVTAVRSGNTMVVSGIADGPLDNPNVAEASATASWGTGLLQVPVVLGGSGGSDQLISSWTGNGTPFLSAVAATTNHKFIHVANDGVTLYLGIESLAGSNLVAGGVSYSGVLTTVGADPLILGTASIARLLIGATGNVEINTGSLSVTLGDLILSKTIVAPGTTGAQTIHKLTGRVNFAAGATSLVVTCNFCTANSNIQVTKATNDGTARLGAAVAGAGSFTIFMDVGPAGECAVNFRLTN